MADGSQLDFETDQTHAIAVRTTDSGGLTFDENVTINVNDVNESPADIQLTNDTVEENSPNGMVVGDLGTLDPDVGDSHTFQLLDDANGRFAINGNQLVVADGSQLDFETDQTHDITVRTTDSGGLTLDRMLTVELLDVPDSNNAPVANDDGVTMPISPTTPTNGDDNITFSNAPLEIASAELLANDSDADSDPLEIVGVGNAVNGTVNFDSASDMVTFTLSDASMAGSFEYDIEDGNGGSASATVTVMPADTSAALDALSGNDTVFADDSDNTVFGNAGDDQIEGAGGADNLNGGDGDDVLIGGMGADLLTGNAGVDEFMFNTPSEGVDLITDFTPGADKILVSESGFGGGLGSGLLSSLLFTVTTTILSVSPSTRFIYNPSSGDLFFDPDGGLPLSSPEKFATLDGAPSLSVSDIEVV